MPKLTYGLLRAQEQTEVRAAAERILSIQSMTGHQRQALAEYITSVEHRTNQQTIMRVVIWPLLSKWAEAYHNNRYDARNQATVEFAKDAVMPARCFPLV